jgi:hypothetical protein
MKLFQALQQDAKIQLLISLLFSITAINENDYKASM